MIAPKTLKPSPREEPEAYELVARRDGRACVRCGYYGAPQLDHIQNRLSGNTVPANLQTLCGPGGNNCHQWKTDHPDDAITEGFARSRFETADPTTIPARRYIVGHGLVWVLYGRGTDFAIIADDVAHARRRELGMEF